MSKIRKPSELKTAPLLKTLIYGQPGIGKTTLALSMPNPLLIDTDRGVHRVDPRYLTDTVQVESWSDINESLNAMLPYDTIIFDTAGRVLDYMTEHVISNNPKLKQSDGSLSLKGYGARKTMFQNLLGALHVMGKHVVFVAHEREERDGDIRFVRPEIGGSSGNDLIRELDLVGYMEAVGKKRTISFCPQERFYAKNSINLPEFMPVTDIAKENKFMTGILAHYTQSQEKRSEMIANYEAINSVIDEAIESITNEHEANEAIGWIGGLQHIWDSKLRASIALRDKAKLLELKYNKERGCYEKN